MMAEGRPQPGLGREEHRARLLADLNDLGGRPRGHHVVARSAERGGELVGGGDRAAHAREGGDVAGAGGEQIEARVLEAGGEGRGARNLVLPRVAFDGAFTHRRRHDDAGRVVVDGAVDSEVVPVEALAQQPMRRHLGACHVLERHDVDVETLHVPVLLRIAEVARGDLHLEVAVAHGHRRLARVLACEGHAHVVLLVLDGVRHLLGDGDVALGGEGERLLSGARRGQGGVRRLVGLVLDGEHRAGGRACAEVGHLHDGAVNGLARAPLAHATHEEADVREEGVEREAPRREQVVDGVVLALEVDAVAVGAVKVRIARDARGPKDRLNVDDGRRARVAHRERLCDAQRGNDIGETRSLGRVMAGGDACGHDHRARAHAHAHR
mmetsp:Transcript_18992/g.43700  ORF Transcript_18992/g.43700 Transcript_18992/m.43700 type:complete len:382 (+) Transcript_18992:611-1756(+)